MQKSADISEAIQAFQRGDLDRALELSERALEAAPSPQLKHLLGLIHCRRGEPAKGVEHLREAALAEPGNAAFQVMLVRALVDSGRAEEALQMPRPAGPMSPAALALWQARGEAADMAGKPDLSAEAWSAVTAAAPDDWRAWSNLGNALAALGEWSEASDALAAAARLNPSETAIRANAAAALSAAGRQHNSRLRFDEAQAAFRRAHELDPKDPTIVVQLGAALERTNRLDELEALLGRARADGVAEARLAYLAAALARRQGRLAEAAELLGKADPADDPVAWNALAAKLQDALGNTAEAFAAATAMNRAAIDRAVKAESRDDWERETAAYRDEQRGLARMITTEWGARLPVLRQPLRQRVSFLVGFPRSGTTLLDTFLLGHPEVAVLEEEQLVAAASAVTGPVAGLADVTLATMERARNAYLDRLAERVGAQFAGLTIDKFPLDMASAPLIHSLFPDAPILFAQRHPCDVVLSGFLQPFGMVNFSGIEAAADYYDAMMSVWTAARAALDLNVHTVVYEELVRDPEAVLRPTVAFLGLEWDDRILDHRRTAVARGTIVTPSYDQVTEPVSTRPSGRWKRYRKQLEPVLPTLLPWAERLGYSD